MRTKFSESDMYDPIKKFFLSLDYKVNGEVKNCDITLLKEDRLIVIEMKKSFNLPLVYQAMDRKNMAEEVYMAIPRMKNTRSKQYKNVLMLTKKLGLGLITVAMDSPVKTVEIIVFPDIYNEKTNDKKKLKLITEISNRTFDLNKGGSSQRKLMTAYRERTIKIACVLEKYGPLKAADLVNLYGCDKHSHNIVYTNNYGWFNRLGGGLYILTDKGKTALDDGQFIKIVEYYRNEMAQRNTEKEGKQ